MIESIYVSSSGKSILIDKDESPYILENIDWGSPQISFEQYKYPQQIGEEIVSTSIGTRPVTITGYIIGDTNSQIEARKDYLNNMIVFGEEITISFLDKKITGFPSDVVSFGADSKTNNDVLCKFGIYIECSDPQFHDLKEQSNDMSIVNPAFYFPFALTKNGFIFSEKKISNTVAINNLGSNSVGMIIILNAIGNVENPQIIDVSTQSFFKINKKMVYGEMVTINTNIGERNIIGELDDKVLNYYKYRDIDSTWLLLKRGTNVLAYTADSGSELLEVSIKYTQAYMSVKEL